MHYYNNVYIHIGLPKAGSTYLQRNIFPFINADYAFLSEEALDYIRLTHNFNIALFKQYVYSTIISNNYSDLIISHEILSGAPEGSPTLDYITIADRLKLSFPNARIILVLRNQIDYLFSLYKFRVLNRGFCSSSFENFILSNLDTLKYRICYDNLLSHYQDLYSKNNTLVLYFEDLKDNINHFLEKLFSFINLPIPSCLDNNPENAAPDKLNLLVLNRLLNIPLKNSILIPYRLGYINKEEYRRYRTFIYNKKRAFNTKYGKYINRYSLKYKISSRVKNAMRDDINKINSKLQSMVLRNLEEINYIIK